MIAGKMGTKNARQCKERWSNYLNPCLSSAPWTPEDDFLLLEKYRELGPRWVAITKCFPNRTDAMVKNRFNRIRRWSRRRQQFQGHEDLAFVLSEPKPMTSSSPQRCFPTIEFSPFDDVDTTALDDSDSMTAWPDSSMNSDDCPDL
jgi:hypothetical protein